MSGGRYDYFHVSGPDRAGQIEYVLLEMVAFAERVGADEGAPKILARLRKMTQASTELRRMLESNERLLHDIEWSASGDYGRTKFFEHEEVIEDSL